MNGEKPGLKPTIHPLVAGSLSSLARRAHLVPLQDCEHCRNTVEMYGRRCMSCQADAGEQLLAWHYRGGRLLCERCFTVRLEKWEEVQVAKAAGKIPRWVKGDIREFPGASQWSEDWREFHVDGLRWIIASGRISRDLFTPPIAGAEQISKAFLAREPSLPWSLWVAGRVLAGAGAEMLLKGLYIKSGFSIRNPGPEEPLAKLGSKEANWLNPSDSASFGTLLKRHNMRLISPRYADADNGLWLARNWRDEIHLSEVGSYDAGPRLLVLGLALQVLHRDLLEGQVGTAHEKSIAKVLTETRPAFTATGEEK